MRGQSRDQRTYWGTTSVRGVAGARSASTRRRSTSGMTSPIVTSRPSSADSDVTPASAIPHGTIRSYQPRSGSQLSAKPCIVTSRATRMPIAATLRSGPRSSASSHTPLRPATRPARDAEVGADRDQRALESSYVVDDEDAVGEADDRVAGELTRTVPGDLAAAVDVDRPACRRSAARATRCACRRCRPAGAAAAGRCRARSRRRRRRGGGAARPTLPRTRSGGRRDRGGRTEAGAPDEVTPRRVRPLCVLVRSGREGRSR